MGGDALLAIDVICRTGGGGILTGEKEKFE